MFRIESKISTSSPEFKENDAYYREKTAEFRERLTKVKQGGPPEQVERHHKRGKLTARERLDRLFDPNTPFLEFSALAANGSAAMALAVTHIAAAAAGVSWMAVEWAVDKKPSVLGVVTGAVGGLVGITPAAGFVDPTGALIIGLIAGVVCWWGATKLKFLIGVDDSLDAFGVHGVGGLIGALLTGVFAVEAIGGTAGGLEGNWAQVGHQLWGIVATVGYAGLVSWLLLKIIDLAIGVRVTQDEEVQGLDIVLHGEAVP